MSSRPTVGRKTVTTWVYVGKYHGASAVTFTLYHPKSFLLSNKLHLGEYRKLNAGRIESNQAAQSNKGILHYDSKTFAQEGRQTGYYEQWGLDWPSISGHKLVLLTTMVSIFQSPQQANAAFGAQLNGYGVLAAGCDTCDFTVRAVSTGAFVGDQRAIYDSLFTDGFVISEVFFVRGNVLVQNLLGAQLSSIPSKEITQMARSQVYTAGDLDRVAWLQQQP
jgi:hypothetical protein